MSATRLSGLSIGRTAFSAEQVGGSSDDERLPELQGFDRLPRSDGHPAVLTSWQASGTDEEHISSLGLRFKLSKLWPALD